ncbi:olfactory receptor 5AR1-like [Lissotriton helveticus]
MEARNKTLSKEFIFLGLTENPKLKVPLFTLFSLIYIFTVFGNIGIIALIKMAPRLHTAMYFFLSHLSFVDLCYSSVIAPKMLVDLLSKSKRISFLGCFVQLLFLANFGCIEAVLLAAMAYDRYVAVCQPLHYATIMTKTFCCRIMTGIHTGGIIHAIIETSCTFRISFCQWTIHHYCCDIPPLLKLSCSDTTVNEVVLFILGGSILIGSLLVIVMSYAAIILAIFQVHSASGRLRAVSTCTSHFTGVTLYFGTVLFTYLRPSSQYSLDQDKAINLFYSVVIPMLNPLIYSLRNKDVKEARGISL